MDNLYISPSWIKLLNEVHPTEEYEGTYFCKIRMLSSNYLITLPFSDYGVTGTKKKIEKLINKMSNIRKLIKIKYVLTDTEDINSHDSNLSICKLNNFDTSQYSKSFARAVRKSQKEVECKILEDKRDFTYFFEQHKQYSYNQFKRVPLPKIFTEKMFDYFKGKCMILSALRKSTGETCSQILLIKNGGGIYYKYGWSNRLMLNFRPNNLLFHELCTGEIKDDITFVNLGHTWNKAQDLMRFKKNLATDILPAGQLILKNNKFNDNVYETSMRAIRYITKQEVKYKVLRKLPMIERMHRFCC